MNVDVQFALMKSGILIEAVHDKCDRQLADGWFAMGQRANAGAPGLRFRLSVQDHVKGIAAEDGAGRGIAHDLASHLHDAVRRCGQ